MCVCGFKTHNPDAKQFQNVRGSGGQISREAYQAKLEKSWTFAERTDSQRLVKFLVTTYIFKAKIYKGVNIHLRSDFQTSAGNVLLTLLEESSISEEKSVSQVSCFPSVSFTQVPLSWFTFLNGLNPFFRLIMEYNSDVFQDKEVVFSEKVVYLSFGDYPGLIGGAIIGLHFAPDQEGILLTVHAPGY